MRIPAKSPEHSETMPPTDSDMMSWSEETLPKLSGRSELAAAFRYMHSRWIALTRCFDDGRLTLDNNAAKRAIRSVAIGRKNWFFTGSDRGGMRAAAMYSVPLSARRNESPPLMSRSTVDPNRRASKPASS